MKTQRLKVVEAGKKIKLIDERGNQVCTAPTLTQALGRFILKNHREMNDVAAYRDFCGNRVFTFRLGD